MRYFFSTVELAALFEVTRTTVSRWIKSELVSNTLNHHQHHRIALPEVILLAHHKRPELASVLQAHASLRHVEPLATLSPCWDYHRENTSDLHDCSSCLVRSSGSKLCFLLRRNTRHKKVFCRLDCQACAYFQDLLERTSSCWLYHELLGKNERRQHRCRECLVLISSADHCHQLRRHLGPLPTGCTMECAECAYYQHLRSTFQHCWELNERCSLDRHSCSACLVYRARVHDCRTLRARVNPGSIGCSSNCNDCLFYQKALAPRVKD
ncbi:MAG: hypothetical protein A2284_06135 [Deltaproteobacteria bacterium RIFOXYA12_FULL_61_11]|nr:MAG: hypothetical protein A2284_06135 [Deltaproteobacteria bacterium RIFOXYA12_FULL_61_11]